MENRHPFSATKKHGGGMYGSRSSYMKSKELAANSDEDNVHDSLSDEGLSVSQFFCVTIYCELMFNVLIFLTDSL